MRSASTASDERSSLERVVCDAARDLIVANGSSIYASQFKAEVRVSSAALNMIPQARVPYVEERLSEVRLQFIVRYRVEMFAKLFW